MKKPIFCLLLLSNILGCTLQKAETWGFDPFNKPDENPVLEADPAPVFNSHVTGELVHWVKKGPAFAKA